MEREEYSHSNNYIEDDENDNYIVDVQTHNKLEPKESRFNTSTIPPTPPERPHLVALQEAGVTTTTNMDGRGKGGRECMPPPIPYRPHLEARTDGLHESFSGKTIDDHILRDTNVRSKTHNYYPEEEEEEEEEEGDYYNNPGEGEEIYHSDLIPIRRAPPPPLLCQSSSPSSSFPFHSSVQEEKYTEWRQEEENKEEGNKEEGDRNKEETTHISSLPIVIEGCYLFPIHHGKRTRSVNEATITFFIIEDGSGDLAVRGEGTMPFMLRIKKDSPIYCCKDKEYLMRDPNGMFYHLYLPVNLPDNIVENLELELMCIARFYKRIVSERKKVAMEAETMNPSTTTKIAKKISRKGSLASEMVVEKATSITDAVRTGQETIKRVAPQGKMEIEDKNMEELATGIEDIRKTARGVTRGITQVTDSLGREIAHGAFFGLKTAKKATKPLVGALDGEGEGDHTGYHKPTILDKGKKHSIGAVEIGRSTVGAGKAIISASVIGAKMVGGEARDSSSEIMEHTGGTGYGDVTRTGINAAADTALTGYHGLQLASWAYKPVPKIAVKLARGTLTYDPFAQGKLTGDPWISGWMKLEGAVREQWQPRWAVLRTYSIAWYPSQKASITHRNHPISYINLSKLIKIKRMGAKYTKHLHSMEIVSQSKIQLVSFHFFPGEISTMEENIDENDDETKALSLNTKEKRKKSGIESILGSLSPKPKEKKEEEEKKEKEEKEKKEKKKKEVNCYEDTTYKEESRLIVTTRLHEKQNQNNDVKSVISSRCTIDKNESIPPGVIIVPPRKPRKSSQKPLVILEDDYSPEREIEKWINATLCLVSVQNTSQQV